MFILSMIRNEEPMNHCADHSGFCARLDAHEKAIDQLWKAVNGIKAWIIAGMGSMIVYFLTVAGDKIFHEVVK